MRRAARQLVDAKTPWHRFAPPGSILAFVESRTAQEPAAPVSPQRIATSHESRIEALCELSPALRASGAREALYGLLRARRLGELEGFLRHGGV